MVSETNFSCILLTESINQFIKYNLIMTCLHEFRIYESLNLFHEKFLFSFKVAAKCLFLEIDAFHDLEFYLVLKELGKKIVKKNFKIFFQRNLTYSSQKLKILIFKT